MVKPQQLQHFEDGKYWSMATTDRPAHLPIAEIWRTSSLQPASAIALDSFRVADHVFHLEGFDANNLVFVNQFAGQLVQIVHPAIGDFSRGVGRPLSGL